MKRKRVWRYYCEHCGRGGCAGGHMKRHEIGCTANPERICSIHKLIGDPQPTMSDLIAALTGHGDDWDAAMDHIREVASNCPVCILAAIRQSNIQKGDPWDEEGGYQKPNLGFDFKKELASFWSELRACEQEAEWNRNAYL